MPDGPWAVQLTSTSCLVSSDVGPGESLAVASSGFSLGNLEPRRRAEGCTAMSPTEGAGVRSGWGGWAVAKVGGQSVGGVVVISLHLSSACESRAFAFLTL